MAKEFFDIVNSYDPTKEIIPLAMKKFEMDMHQSKLDMEKDVFQRAKDKELEAITNKNAMATWIKEKTAPQQDTTGDVMAASTGLGKSDMPEMAPKLSTDDIMNKAMEFNLLSPLDYVKEKIAAKKNEFKLSGNLKNGLVASDDQGNVNILREPVKDVKTPNEIELQMRANNGDKDARSTLNSIQADKIRVARESRPVITMQPTANQIDVLAKGIEDGTIDPNGISKRGGLQAAVWGKVKENNPNFDIVEAGVGAKFKGTTQTMQTKALLNTINPLLDELVKAGGVLGNTNIPIYNQARNYLKEKTGDASIVGFNNLRDSVVAEVERGLMGTGVLSDSKYQRELKNINSAQSMAQLQAAVENTKIVINERLKAIDRGPNTKFNDASKKNDPLGLR
jgi:hypothetical protein